MLMGRYFRLSYDKITNTFRSMRKHGMEAKGTIKSGALIRLIK
jgi:hypothetical protein